MRSEMEPSAYGHASASARIRAAEIELNQNPAQIENDGFMHGHVAPAIDGLPLPHPAAANQ